MRYILSSRIRWSLSAFKEYPMEIAELASMSMELFTMEHWDVFFKDESELHRAKLEELERVISVLPWIATIDKYQHWLYTNPGPYHSEQREDAMDEHTQRVLYRHYRLEWL